MWREAKDGWCGCIGLQQLHGHLGGQRNPVALGGGQLHSASVVPTRVMLVCEKLLVVYLQVDVLNSNMSTWMLLGTRERCRNSPWDGNVRDCTPSWSSYTLINT